MANKWLTPARRTWAIIIAVLAGGAKMIASGTEIIKWYRDNRVAIDLYLVYCGLAIGVIVAAYACESILWLTLGLLKRQKERRTKSQEESLNAAIWDHFGGEFIHATIRWDIGPRAEFKWHAPLVRFPKCSSGRPECNIEVLMSYPSLHCRFCNKDYSNKGELTDVSAQHIAQAALQIKIEEVRRKVATK